MMFEEEIYVRLDDVRNPAHTEFLVGHKQIARALRSIKSDKRANASRENGKKGGRPRKDAVRKMMNARMGEFIKVMEERGNEK